MAAVRVGSLVLMLVCLAVVWVRGLYDGVWLLGLVAGGVFLWSVGLFSRRLWFGDDPCPEPSRLDVLDRGAVSVEGGVMDESLAGRVTVPVARQVLWVLGDDLGHMPSKGFWRVRLIQLVQSVVGNEAPAARDAYRSLSEEFPEYVAAVEAVTGPTGAVDPEPLRRLVKAAEARLRDLSAVRRG
ncbi:hypothetical protein ACWXWW_03280 [Microbacterium sp. KNMS]